MAGELGHRAPGHMGSQPGSIGLQPGHMGLQPGAHLLRLGELELGLHVLNLLVLGVQLAPQLVDLALEQVALGLHRYRYSCIDVLGLGWQYLAGWPVTSLSVSVSVAARPALGGGWG